MTGAVLPFVSERSEFVEDGVEALDAVVSIEVDSKRINECLLLHVANIARLTCAVSRPVIAQMSADDNTKLGVLIIDLKRPGRTFQGRFKSSETAKEQFYCDLPRGWRFGVAGVRIMISLVEEGKAWGYAKTDAFPVWSVDRIDGRGAVIFKELNGELPALRELFREAAIEKKNEVQTKNGHAPVLFDVSDLLAYFKDSRLPTGIQRVQVEIISALIHNPCGRIVEVVAFDRDRDSWVSIPKLFFNHLAVFSLKSGDTSEQVWIEAKADIAREIKTGSLYRFVGEEQLVNLGTSWWIKNYFLAVREAIQKHNISYIPFVHDFIPIVLPEHCMRDLSSEFMDWASSVLSHADRFLVNSNATKGDLMKLANASGRADSIHIDVVTLNADISMTSRHVSLASVFPTHQRTSPDFVLFVSTIESRKNHCLLLDVWMLMERRGLTNIPDLVFVGKRGWLNDHVYAKVNSSSFLQQKVHFLNDVPDEGLSRLYESCLFLAYPSFYEGWGLPVTEALCFGKIPVVSNASSLPEASGGFGACFDPYSTSDAFNQISALVNDRALLKSKEQDVRLHYVPRNWQEISSQIIVSLDLWYSEPRIKVGTKTVTPGKKVSLGSGRLDYPVEFNNSECFRSGNGWWWPEDWGTWTKPCGAEIAFALPSDAIGNTILVAFWIRGVQGQQCDVAIDGIGLHMSFPIGSEETKTALVEFKALDREATFRIRSGVSTDFAIATGGQDTRVAGCGVCGFAVALGSDLASRITLLEEFSFDKVCRVS